MELKEIALEKLLFNPFTKIGREWMLITAGSAESHNTMTASWGGLGVLWGCNAATVYIRPHRYTFEFAEREAAFSLSFFGNDYRDALNLCGTKSGRDCDKPKEAGLTPVFSELAPYYQEASLVFICRKLYRQDLDEGLFIDSSLVDANYPERDFHRVYVGEIVKALERQ
jgi:flavin reductase (DIM6/NTAB) family NADH-FMN oxidoreductase RutF